MSEAVHISNVSLRKGEGLCIIVGVERGSWSLFVICKWAQTLALPGDGNISRRRRITLFKDLYRAVYCEN